MCWPAGGREGCVCMCCMCMCVCVCVLAGGWEGGLCVYHQSVLPMGRFFTASPGIGIASVLGIGIGIDFDICP